MLLIGIYCCGLVLMVVIKRGDCFVNYDIVFVFFEVNVDKIVWCWLKEDKW